MAFSLFNRKQQEQPVKEERSYPLRGLSFNTFSTYTTDSSMKLSAVYAATNQISNSCAMLPINIVKVTGQGRSKEKVEHPLWDLLNSTPDGKYTHFNWMKQMIESVILKGDAFAYIERDGNLKVKAIRYIDSQYVTPVIQEDGSVKYLVHGMDKAVDSENMIHLYQHVDEYYNGISVIRYAAKTLRIANDAELQAANFFRSGGNLSGVLKPNAPINNEQKKQIAESWKGTFDNASDKVSVAVLPYGLDYQPISVSPEDSQLLESREFNVIEIARFFNISPIKLFDLEEVSYSSMEATQLYYLQDTIMPYVQMMEDEFNRKLFRPSERGKYSVDFDFTELLTANKETEAKYYKELLVNGFITINEARAKLGFSPIPTEEGGDEHFMQLSYSTLKNIKDGVLTKQQTQVQSQDVDNKVK